MPMLTPCRFHFPLAISATLASGLLLGAAGEPLPVLTGHAAHDNERIARVSDPLQAIGMLPDDEELAVDIIANWLGRDMDDRVMDASRTGEITHVIRVGNGNNCDFSSPRAAAANAPPPPAVTHIRIATNRDYSGSETRIRIENKDVILEGGYIDCVAAAPATNARTTIDTSTSSTNRPVVRIRNQDDDRLMRVEIRRMVLQGGTTTTSSTNCSLSDRNGAGINIRGRSSVELIDTIVRNNDTTSGSSPVGCAVGPVNQFVNGNKGGGIYFNGEDHPDSELTLGAGSGVLGNSTNGTGSSLDARGEGGGIACVGNARIILEPDTGVANNRVRGARRGNGGGLAIGFFQGIDQEHSGTCTLISRAGGSGLTGVFNNQLLPDPEGGFQEGGGISVGFGSSVTLEPGPGRGSPRLVNNTSAREGGGLALRSNASALLIDADISGNFAQGEGGGISMTGDSTLEMRHSGQACANAPFDRCSRLSNNGADGHGGALIVSGLASADISRTHISANSSGGLGSAGFVRGDDAEVRLEGVAIHSNFGSSRLFQVESGTLRVFWSTIAGNEPNDGATLQVFRTLENDGQPFLNVQRSIVWQPGAIMVNASGNTFSRAFCTIGHFGTQNQFDDTSSYSEINPRLVNVDQGDLRLQPDSPAIDYCSPGGTTVAPRFDDLFGNPRGVPYDGSTVPAPSPGNGDFDIGVHEQQPSGPLPPDEDEIFNDRFKP